MNIRYIRLSSSGNSANLGNQIVEFQANDVLGVNQALGILPTNVGIGIWTSLAIATNGNYSNSNEYASGGDGSGRSVSIDLNSIIDINNLRLWRYFADGRYYKSNIIEVSTDNINWVTVFNSNLQGTYIETSEGKIFYLDTNHAGLPPVGSSTEGTHINSTTHIKSNSSESIKNINNTSFVTDDIEENYKQQVSSFSHKIINNDNNLDIGNNINSISFISIESGKNIVNFLI